MLYLRDYGWVGHFATSPKRGEESWPGVVLRGVDICDIALLGVVCMQEVSVFKGSDDYRLQRGAEAEEGCPQCGVHGPTKNAGVFTFAQMGHTDGKL